jgi:uncharacterized membrane protein YqhA
MMSSNQTARANEQDIYAVPLAPLGRALGRTRFIVIIAVLAVMAIAVSLFLLGSLQAVLSVRAAWTHALQGNMSTTNSTVEFLEVVGVMLKAVVFYLIGIGLYSLFIAPLNITVALGVETLTDLESKVLSVIVVIMSTTFLEHFIQWKEPLQTLQFGASLALVVVALVLFQSFSHRAKEDQKAHSPDVQTRAQQEMFYTEHEHHEIKSDEVAGTKKGKPNGSQIDS